MISEIGVRRGMEDLLVSLRSAVPPRQPGCTLDPLLARLRRQQSGQPPSDGLRRRQHFVEAELQVALSTAVRLTLSYVDLRQPQAVLPIQAALQRLRLLREQPCAP